jgi:FtsP/CotA-like multicopper oxidase with cupredoxin domain
MLHDGARVRYEWERAGGNVIAVPLAGLCFGEADAGDLRVSVDRARDGRSADGGVVPARVLGGCYALAEGGMGELPMASAIADGVDMRNGGAPMRVGDDTGPPVELDTDPFEPQSRDERSSADRDKHQVRPGRSPRCLFDLAGPAPDDSALSTRLAETPTTAPTPSSAVPVRDFQFRNNADAGWAINGLPFDPARPDAIVARDTTEVWRFTGDATFTIT